MKQQQQQPMVYNFMQPQIRQTPQLQTVPYYMYQVVPQQPPMQEQQQQQAALPSVVHKTQDSQGTHYMFNYFGKEDGEKIEVRDDDNENNTENTQNSEKMEEQQKPKESMKERKDQKIQKNQRKNVGFLDGHVEQKKQEK